MALLVIPVFFSFYCIVLKNNHFDYVKLLLATYIEIALSICDTQTDITKRKSCTFDSRNLTFLKGR